MRPLSRVRPASRCSSAYARKVPKNSRIVERQLAPRAARRSRPPYNLRHELYGDRVLRTTCAASCTPVASSYNLRRELYYFQPKAANSLKKLSGGGFPSFQGGNPSYSGGL